MSRAEAQPLTSVTTVEYTTDDDKRVSNSKNNRQNTAEDSANLNAEGSRGGGSGTYQNMVYQFEVVDASGLIAGSKEAKEHKELIERIAQLDFLHKLFLYISIPSFIIAGIIAIILYSTKTIQAESASRGVAIECTVATIILSVFLIYCHLTAYTNPPQQRFICRILLMAPIYAIDSTIGLFAYKEGSLAAIVRDTYEAYVIYMFYRLLLDYMGSEEKVLEMWAEFKPEGMDHLFPMNIIFWFKKCPLNQRTLSYMKFCLIQYMILRPLLTIITVPLYFTDHYKEGDFDPKGNAYLYFALIQNASVFFAFTSLVYFYFACKEFLQPYDPGMKFVVVKAVVFMCFWQGILIAVLNHFHVIPHSQNWTADDVGVGLQNLIVTIEMFIVALAHRWIFTDTPYIPVGGRMKLRSWQVLHLFSISDVLEEAHKTVLVTPGVIVEHAKQLNAERKAAKEKSTLMASTNSMKPLISDSEGDQPIGE